MYRTANPEPTRQPTAAIIMARYIKIATPNPFFFSKNFQHSTPLSSACCFWKLKLGSLPQLNFTSTAMSRCEDNAEDHSLEYNWIDGAENLEKYNPKGYHPIMIGDVLHGRYRIVDKLGFGGYNCLACAGQVPGRICCRQGWHCEFTLPGDEVSPSSLCFIFTSRSRCDSISSG